LLTKDDLDNDHVYGVHLGGNTRAQGLILEPGDDMRGRAPVSGAPDPVADELWRVDAKYARVTYVTWKNRLVGVNIHLDKRRACDWLETTLGERPQGGWTGWRLAVTCAKDQLTIVDKSLARQWTRSRDLRWSAHLGVYGTGGAGAYATDRAYFGGAGGRFQFRLGPGAIIVDGEWAWPDNNQVSGAVMVGGRMMCRDDEKDCLAGPELGLTMYQLGDHGEFTTVDFGVSAVGWDGHLAALARIGPEALGATLRVDLFRARSFGLLEGLTMDILKTPDDLLFRAAIRVGLGATILKRPPV
jgi:hypothetical protein